MAQLTEIEVQVMFWIGTLGILLPTIAGILFFVFYQRRLLKQQKENKAKEAYYQQELLAANIETQENVRKQIAKDLHDDIGANLSAIKLYINQIQHKLEKQQFPVALTEQTKELATDTIHNVRHISHNLLPPLLEDFGLIEALQDFCDKLNGSDVIQVNLKSQGYKSRLETQQELALYRIVQELANNTLKHAQARQINIHLYKSNQQVKLIYQDDGVGFDMSADKRIDNQLIKKEKKGLGLKSIESRVKVLNGKMTFYSEKKQGIQVEIYINL